MAFVEIDDYARQVIEKNFGAVLACERSTHQTPVNRMVRVEPDKRSTSDYKRQLSERGDLERGSKKQLASVRELCGFAEVSTHDSAREITLNEKGGSQLFCFLNTSGCTGLA